MIRDVFDVEVVESQRFFPIIGWGKKRMPTDRGEWTDREGSRVSKEQLDSLLPGDGVMAWTSEWKLYKPPGEEFDEDGWQYALDFPRKFGGPKGPADFVRRRFWRRSFLMTESERAKRLLAIEADRPAGLTTADFTLLRNITFAGQEALEKIPGGPIPPLGFCASCNSPFTIFSLKIECADCHKVCCGTCCRRCRVREEETGNDDDEDDEGKAMSPKTKDLKDKAAIYLCQLCDGKFRKEYAVQIQIKVRDRLSALTGKEETRRSSLAHQLYDEYLADPVWAAARASRSAAKEKEDARLKQELEEKNNAKIQQFRSDDRKRAARVHIAVPCAMGLKETSERAEWFIRVVVVHDRDPSATNTLILSKANEVNGCGIAAFGEWVAYSRDPILNFSATIDVKDDRQPVYVILQEKHSKSIGDAFSKLLSSKAPARFHHWAEDKEISAHVLGHAQVNLRADIVTKKSDVSQTGVYLETCAVNCEIAAPEAPPFPIDPAAPTATSKTASTVMIQWRLEVREVLREQSSVAFCDKCGKMRNLCSCHA